MVLTRQLLPNANVLSQPSTIGNAKSVNVFLSVRQINTLNKITDYTDVNSYLLIGTTLILLF